MRAIKRIVPFILCVVLAVALIACSDPGAPEHAVNPKYAVSESEVIGYLSDFVKQREDRTTFKEGEKNAAEYLAMKLVSMGYGGAFIQDFTTTENEVGNLSSQNVVAQLAAKNSGKKTRNVVIGAYYDNRYSSPYRGAEGDSSEGALNGGSGVAAVLSIANYLIEHKSALSLDFDVTFVFFGASYYSAAGAENFLSEMRKDAEASYAGGKNGSDVINNTVLMVELQRLGCDHVYAFSDARETKREKLFDRVASENGLDIYKVTQKSPIVTMPSTLKGVPYYQWAHNGVFGAFFNEGIPTLNLVGANWETADMSNAESKDHPNISFTKNDTLLNFLKLYPDCGAKIAQAATLVIKSLADKAFLETMEYDAVYFPESNALCAEWVWYLVVLGIIVLAFVGMYIIYMHIGKKYPIKPVTPVKMKMAVFGMDYEDKQPGNIYIDLSGPSPNEEIFPGIANNARHKPADPIDDIFPPPEPPRDRQRSDDDKADDDKADE